MLSRSFKVAGKKGLDTFWETFKDKRLFDSLINVLELDEAEKARWWVSYEYQMTITSTLIARIKNNTHHFFKGSSINITLLKEKADKVADQLLQLTFNESLSELDKGLKLTQLVNYHEREGLRVLQHKLEGCLNVLSMPIPLSFDRQDYQYKLDALDEEAVEVRSDNIKRQNNIRRLLNQLYRGLKELSLVIKTDVEHTKLYTEGVPYLKKLIEENALLLTKTECYKGKMLCDKALDEWHKALWFISNEPKNVTLQALNDYHLKREKEIESLQSVIQKSLKKLEEKGKTLREEALGDLSVFLSTRHGFWEQLFRIISPTYRRCMLELYAILKHQELSTLNKMDAIINTIEDSKKKGICLVHYRFMALYQAGSMMFFAPEDDRHKPRGSQIEAPAFSTLRGLL